MSLQPAIAFFLPFAIVFLQVTSASPIVQARDENAQQNGPSPWVIKLMVIALVLFLSVLLALYLYRKLKPGAGRPQALFEAPPMRHRVMIGPVMGSRPPWGPLIRSSSGSSRAPFARNSFSSEQTLVLGDIPHPIRAHTKPTKLNRPTAGTTPL